jgi:hypothetical protein
MCKNCEAIINMCLGEVYCKDCGKKEYYNSNNPLSRPSKCRHCDGEITDYQTEKFIKKFEEDIKEALDYHKEIRNKNRSKEDQFVIDLLESLKEQFANENVYSGLSVKLIINGYIKRME